MSSCLFVQAEGTHYFGDECSDGEIVLEVNASENGLHFWNTRTYTRQAVGSHQISTAGQIHTIHASMCISIVWASTLSLPQPSHMYIHVHS